MPPIRALIHIDPMADDIKSQIDGLKRIAMLFDEIHFIVSSGWRLKEDIAGDPSRYQRGPQGNLLPVGDFKPFVDGYNPLDDAMPAFVLDQQSWPAQLRETIEALTESGIASEVDSKRLAAIDPKKRIEKLRKRFAKSDFIDDEFVSLNHSEKNNDFSFGRLELSKLQGGEEPTEIHYIEFPPPIADSIAIVETLFIAPAISSSAVFLQPRYHRELDYRYRKFRQGVGVLKKHAPEIAASLRLNAHFGEVSFNVANAVVSSRLLESKSVEELIHFRAETNEARQRFISKGLIELDEMVADNAWSPKAREQMNRYIQTKLTSDIIAYNDLTRVVWEKLYGNTRVRLMKVTTASVLGGTAAYQAGGVLGNLIPNATGLGLLLIGALAGVAKEAPGFARDLEDAIAEARKTKRSSIAYVARLSKLD